MLSMDGFKFNFIITEMVIDWLIVYYKIPQILIYKNIHFSYEDSQKKAR